MPATRRILCISWNPDLAREREQILSEAGCEVVSVVGQQAAEKAMTTADPDALVIGHSVPREHKQRLMRAFRRHSDGPILSLLLPGQQPLAEATLGIPGNDTNRLRQVASHFLC